ncbi:MAG: Lon-like protease helical domain-containing protein [Myxococcota bacterium]
MVDPMPADALRWQCPAACVDFATTAEVAPAEGVVGQQKAVDALRFGLSIDAPGQNVYVRGLTGSGRLSLVRDLLRTVQPGSPEGPDHCYVHGFTPPDQPRRLTLPRGAAPAFAERMDEVVRFVVEDLPDLVNTDSLRLRTHEVETAANREAEAVSGPFDRALAAAGLALVGIESEGGTQPAIVAVVDGEPITFDDLEEQVEAGRFDADDAEQRKADAARLEVQLDSVSAQVVKLRRRAQRQVRRLVQNEVLRVMRDAVADVRRSWPDADRWLEDLVQDVSRNHAQFEEHPEARRPLQDRGLPASPRRGRRGRSSSRTSPPCRTCSAPSTRPPRAAAARSTSACTAARCSRRRRHA